MSDPIFDSIREGHDKEIRAELRDKKLEKIPDHIDEILGEMRSIKLHSRLMSDDTTEALEILRSINANIYELHTTQKEIRGYAKITAISAIIFIVFTSWQAWS